MIPQELINKFFSNECNDDERKRVLQYFEENPEAWNKYMNEEDWDQFETGEKLNPFVSKKIFDQVRHHTFNKKAIPSWIAIAASLVLLAGLSWMILVQQNRSKNQATDTVQPVLADVKWQEAVNTTDKKMPVTLEDGSLVILSPKSSVRYRYVDNKRSIHLQGEAMFKVAKDPGRPFTVFADHIATTALGTQFIVTSFAESNEIRVVLQEGKVVVQPADPIHTKWANNFYMIPGDELVYNRNTMLASIKHAAFKEQMVKAGAGLKNKGKVQIPDWYEFKGLSLAQVFDQLSAYYQVDIYYYPADISNKYFTQEIRKTDSLENILKDIALLNRLSITRKDGAYFIKKEK
jgi:ferric-dicitrate binding protein FerR (iron transport regulator)